MKLKPGMRVKVEYEAIVGGADDVLTLDYNPSCRVNPDGSAVFPSQMERNFKVTPIENQHTVTVTVRGYGVTEDQARSAVRNALPRSLHWPYTANDGSMLHTEVEENARKDALG